MWPFETGLNLPARSSGQSPLIVHAEIYPAVVKALPKPSKVKDRAQVRALARCLAAKDASGTLADLFAGSADLSADQKKTIENEEGWILGVNASAKGSGSVRYRAATKWRVNPPPPVKLTHYPAR